MISLTLACIVKTSISVYQVLSRATFFAGFALFLALASCFSSSRAEVNTPSRIHAEPDELTLEDFLGKQILFESPRASLRVEFATQASTPGDSAYATVERVKESSLYKVHFKHSGWDRKFCLRLQPWQTNQNLPFYDIWFENGSLWSRSWSWLDRNYQDRVPGQVVDPGHRPSLSMSEQLPKESQTAITDCPPGWQPAFSYDTAEYPFTNRCIDVGFGQMHYIDEGPPDSAMGTVLLLHGNPTWSFLYRNIAKSLLAQGFRVLAPDFYGFGLSDKPPSASYGYFARDHAQTLESFVEALALRELTVVVQDLGGPAGLAVAENLPSRFRNFVLLNTVGWEVDPFQPGVHHVMVNWATTNIQNEAFHVSNCNMARNVGELLASLHGPPGSPEFLAVRNAYWGPFLDLNTGLVLTSTVCEPPNRTPQSILLDSGFLADIEANIGALTDKPVYFVFGAYDRFFGALACDFGAVNECPPGQQCNFQFGRDYCLDTNQEVSYPYLERFMSYWPPHLIRGVEIGEFSGHFVQEYEGPAIVQAIKILNLHTPPSQTQAPAGGPPGFSPPQ